jgi:hypothetical protein
VAADKAHASERAERANNDGSDEPSRHGAGGDGTVPIEGDVGAARGRAVAALGTVASGEVGDGLRIMV